jgi:glycosyltransferase involved in cell wall biosynthesis
MRITHLTSVHPPDDNRIFKLCRSVARANRTVSYVVPTDADAFVDGVAIKAVPTSSSRLTRMLHTTWHVYRRSVKERAQIYQFHDPELIPVGLALQLLHGRHVIYDVHENVPDTILGKHYIPRPLRRLIGATFDQFERQAAKRFSAIVTANEDISERFENSKNRVLSIHNYAEAEEFSDATLDTSRYTSGLIFHSAASERTAFPAVVRAIELIPGKINLKLIASGITTDEVEDAARIVPISLSNRICTVGKLPRKEMVQTYLRCAVSLVFYADSRNHSSVRSNRLYESFAAAAPVIVSDFPEWRELVESIGCGLAVNPSSPQEIGDAIQYLLAHPTESAEMGRRGQQAFLQSFSWTHESNRLLELYDMLVVGGSSTETVTATNP